MNIDPLTEQYNTWSLYVFSGNRVIARELEGLESHVLHEELQEATRNLSEQYNGYSIENKVEVSTQFYRTESGKYGYATPMMFGEGMAYPSQSNDFPKGAVFAGDVHTHGREDMTLPEIVMPNVTSGGPLTTNQMSKLKLNDFGTGDSQNQVLNGKNGPSPDDKQASVHSNTNSGTFERSYVLIPSGLVYGGGVSKDGKTIEYKINYNLSKTNPSQSDSRLRINNVSSTATTPVVPPVQGQIKTD